ncbi:MAG: GNAT family N-acetyltransferase [Acidimicrobiia bacterium]
MGRTYRLGVTGIPHVRPAGPADFDSVLEIRDQVAVDLLGRGFHWNPNVLTRAQLADWSDRGVLFIAEIKGQVIGSIAVWRRDPGGWWPTEDRAGYVRDLMIHPRFRSQNVGAIVLRWAEKYAAGLGLQRVRLDCLSSNDRLCRYYMEAGYRRVATDTDGVVYFEKSVS